MIRANSKRRKKKTVRREEPNVIERSHQRSKRIGKENQRSEKRYLGVEETSRREDNWVWKSGNKVLNEANGEWKEQTGDRRITQVVKGSKEPPACLSSQQGWWAPAGDATVNKRTHLLTRALAVQEEQVKASKANRKW